MINKPKYINFAFIAILFIQSCTSDYNKELSGGYVYADESAEDHIIRSSRPGNKSILGTVVAYDFNDDYILALQKPDYNNHKNGIAAYLRLNDQVNYPGKTTEDIQKVLIAADSIAKTDTYYQKIFAHKINYWIIAHKQKQVVYGPLTEAEYLQKRKELNVPGKLKLEPSE